MEHDERINVRLPAAMHERIGAFAEALREGTGLRVTLNEAVRVLIVRALDGAPETTRRKRR